MGKGLDELIEELESRGRVRFTRLFDLCEGLFGKPRIRGSHHVFRTGVVEAPIINIQPEKKDAKDYQVRQVLRVLRILKEREEGEEDA